MNYKLIFNIPNEEFLTEVLVSEEQMEQLEGPLNSKKIIKIGNEYYNTVYFAKSVPDSEGARIEGSKILQIPARSQKTKSESIKSTVDKIKKNLKDKNIL